MANDKKIRLKDIANYAGVSVATVSMALADNPQVNEETRRKIKLASRKLGYNKTPRLFSPQGVNSSSLQGRRFGYLLIGNRLDEESKIILAHALASNAAQRGVRFELSAIEQVEDTEVLLRQTIEYASDLDGVVLSFSKDAKNHEIIIEELGELNIPFVLLGHLPTREELVLPSNCEVIAYSCLDMGQSAVEYLRYHGHDRIGFVSENAPEGMVQDRWLSGYQLGMVRNNITPLSEWIHIAGKAFAGGGPAAEAMAKLDNDARPTAYVVPDIRTAASFIREMKERGIKLDETSIVMGGERDLTQMYHLEKYPLISVSHDNLAALSFRRLGELCLTSVPCSSVTIVPFEKHNMQ